jgi:hypothetical protein
MPTAKAPLRLNSPKTVLVPVARFAEWYAQAIQTAGLADTERRALDLLDSTVRQPSRGSRDRSRAASEGCDGVGEAEEPPARSADSGLAL